MLFFSLLSFLAGLFIVYLTSLVFSPMEKEEKKESHLDNVAEGLGNLQEILRKN